MNSPALLIPVKDFSKAKLRLSPRLDEKSRTNLARNMAETVIAAAGTMEVFIACEDQSVADWAQNLGAEIIWSQADGLNEAVQNAAEHLKENGYQEMIAAHSDLPKADSFEPLINEGQVCLVADRHRTGTNAIRVPLDAGFNFGFGKNSFTYHLGEASRLGLSSKVVRAVDLVLDIDLPEDLDLLDSDLLNQLTS